MQRPDRHARTVRAKRLRRLARAMRLTRVDTAILELMLSYNTVSLVRSMADDIFFSNTTCWNFRAGNWILPCLLGLSPGAVHGRFAPAAPLLTSGLVSIDDDDDVTLVRRLIRLHWVPKAAGFDVPRLLLDEAGPGELSWSDFDHVAGDRNHLERILNGALRTDQKGVNVLIYGPPGTGKTEFCKTLAAQLEAPLYVVGESDADGGEPHRKERLQELRLAQRLLAGDRRSILLFDEMEDLLSMEGGVLAALFGPRRNSRAFGRRFESVHEQALGGDSSADPVDVERRPVDQSRSLTPHDVRFGTAPASGQGAGAGLGATARAPWYRVDRRGCPRLRSGVRCNTGRRLRGHCGRKARWRDHRGRTPWPARTHTVAVGQHAASSSDIGQVRSPADPC